MADKCSRVNNPEDHFVEGTNKVSNVDDLFGRIKSIYKIADEAEVSSRDTPLTSTTRLNNFIEELNTDEGKVKLRQTGFTDKDISTLQRIVLPSFELARKFKPMNEAQQVAFTQKENLEILLNRYKTDSKGNLAKPLALPRKLVPDFQAVIVEADKRQINFSDKQLKEGIDILGINEKKIRTVKFNQEQIDAFREHKQIADRQLSDIFDALDYITLWQFKDKPFIKELQAVVEKKGDAKVFEIFGQEVLDIVTSDDKTARVAAGVEAFIGDNAAETFSNMDNIVNVVLAKDEAFNLTDEDIPADLEGEERDDFIKTYKKLISRKASLSVLRKQMGTQDFYFSRQRGDGKFILIINRKDKSINLKEEINNGFKQPENIRYYKRFDTEKERQKEIAQLKKDFPEKEFDFLVDTQSKVSEYQFQNISDNAIENFLNRSLEQVKRGGIITEEQMEDIRDSMIATVAEDLKTRGFSRQLKARKEGSVIHGYDIDNYKQTFNQVANGVGGFITKQVAGLEYARILRETPGKDSLFSPQQEKLYDEVHRFSKDMLANQSDLDRLSGKLRSFAFVWYLTGQFRTPLLNLTQNFILGVPELSKITNFAGTKYSKAMLDVARLKANEIAGRGKPASISDEDFEIMEELRNRGIVGAQFARDSIDVAKSQLGEKFAKTINLIARPFAFTEELNRQSAALTMIRVARQQGKSRADIINQARKFVLDVHFAFGKENLQAIARDTKSVAAPFIRAGLTFRTFTNNYLFALERGLGNKEFGMLARTMAYTLLLGGVSSIPFLDDLMKLVEKFTGKPYRKIVQNEMQGLGGDYLANFGTKGLPALMGADISGSLRLRLPSEGTPAEVISQAAFGIWGSLASNVVRGFEEGIRGRYLRALENVSPAILKNQLRVARENVEGVREFSGKAVLDEEGNPLVPKAGEKVLRRVGFQPTRVSVRQEERFQLKNIVRSFNKRRQRMIDDFNSATTQGRRKKIERKISAFNNSAPILQGLVKPITNRSLGRRREVLTEADIAFGRARF